MNIQRMREEVRETLGDRIGDFDNSRVDEALNYAWQFILPNLIQGRFRDEHVSFVLKVGQATYDLTDANDVGSELAGRVRSVGEDFRHTDNIVPLTYYTEPGQFYTFYRPDYQGTGRSYDVLHVGDTLTFRPTPAVARTIMFKATMYPKAIKDPDGLANDEEAWATVRAASAHLAGTQGYEEIEQTQTQRVIASVSRLRGASRGRPRKQRWRPDF